MESPEYYRKLLDMAALAGEIMIRSGAETHRVEDTLQRILATSNFAHAESFVFTTGFIVTLSDPESETLSVTQRITGVHQNLGRITDVNSISRSFCSGKLSLDEAIAALREVKHKRQYPDIVALLGILLASGGFAVVFGGTLLDGLGAVLCGLFLSFTELVLGPKIKKTFITTILGATVLSLCATTLTYFAARLGLVFHSHYMIVGAIMPLVPGIALTNAVRDCLQGDFISAGSRLIEALMIAAAVALGVGAGLSLSGVIGLSSAISFDLVLSASSPLDFLLAASCSAVATAGFAFIFDFPKRYILPVGVIAFVSWAVFMTADLLGISGTWAVFFAAFISDILAHICARGIKAPVILFLLGGIIPLVPGAGIYKAVYNMLFGVSAAADWVGVLYTTGAISLAIIVTDTIFDMGKGLHDRLHEKTKKS